MTKNRRRGGFTLAEMLIVVGIIVVLMGVSFVAVQSYQRSSTRLEFDTIAKEIFIAAQNHLTEAESQGLLDKLDVSALGTLSTLDEDKEKEVYYLLKGDSALEYLLPAYAVDATILAGSYIIRYQPSSGTVLDVFYSRPGNPTFLTKSGTELGEGDYAYESLMAGCKGDDKRSAREGFGSNNAVIGWYGGEDPIPTGERLRAPTFEIHNEEKLWVRVTDPNTSAQINYNIKLIVKGKLSNAEAYFSIVKKINGAVGKGDGPRLQDNGTDIILDDITESGLHFAQITPDKGSFIPGEDLIIQAVAYSTDTLANVAMSAAKTTNSLFADPNSVLKNGSDVDNGSVSILNFRHLENLDAAISDLGGDDTTFTITNATQIADLSWTEFLGKTGRNNVYMIGKNDPKSADGCFLPVTPQYSGDNDTSYSLIYDGQGHQVSDVKVSVTTGAAGLFGMLADGSEVKDLELIDFNITSTSGNAGALVGTAGTTATGVEISNVLAYNDKLTGTNATVTASGSAGGLIGSMSGGKVEKCAAALVVGNKTVGESTITPTNAGGLIGTAASGTVEASYSGGHTNNGKYYTETGDPIYNVTASGKAGGLIGLSSGATIEYSYSTCSAKATDTTSGSAGGFIGSGSGTINYCYCTGLVSGKTEGAFAGGGSITTDPDKPNFYFEIINELKDTVGYTYLKAVNNAEYSGITAFDETAATYQSFSGNPASDWKTAKPYDTTLDTYYQNKYNLQTIAQRVAEAKKVDNTITISVADTDFVSTHYGDWPSPEVFFINTNS